MNEWVLGGLVAIGTVLLIGGGGFLVRVMRGQNKDTNPKA